MTAEVSNVFTSFALSEKRTDFAFSSSVFFNELNSVFKYELNVFVLLRM